MDANGPHARPVATVPAHVRTLITRVKEYERATVTAALSGRREDRVAALALNPLVHVASAGRDARRRAAAGMSAPDRHRAG